MAFLEIQYLTGDHERRELHKHQPVSIGSHPTNDVVVDEEGVELIHARIAWNKDAYEVVAAGVGGVDVNGVLVQRARLQGKEVLRFGSVDVRFHGEPAARAALSPPPAAEESETSPRAGSRPASTSSPQSPPGRRGSAAAGTSGREPQSAMSEPRRELNWDALQALANEAQSAAPEEEVKEAGEEEAAAAEPPPRVSSRGESSPASRRETPSRAAPPAAPPGKSAGSEPAGAAVTSRLRQALRHSQVRPGEEDTIRSPLVLGLGGGAAALVLIGAVFHFMINRQTTQEAFDVARQLYEEGKYANAIKAFTDFLALHGQTEFATRAMILRGRAEVDQLVLTRQDYPGGLEKLRAFISAFQDYEEFEQERSYVANTARTIALKSAQTAGQKKLEDLLKTSDEARTVFTTYAAQDIKPQELIAEIERAKRTAQAEILRTRTQGEAAAAIDAALKKQDAIGAIVAWRNLVGRYEELRSDPKIAGLLQKVLDAERARVVVEEVTMAAETEEHPRDVPPPLTFLFHARSSTDEVSGGRCVLALAKDCCYGIDTVTNEPRWRRVIGLATPFFPLIDSNTGTAVLFDTRQRELVRIDVNSGKLIWRTPLPESTSSPPLLAGGRLLTPTVDGSLWDVNFGDGSIARRVKFSQPVSTPALLPGGERITLAGDQEVFYTLSLASLACERVQYLGNGHPSGSIRAPLLPMGPYLLVCENNADGDSCTLQVLNAAQSSGELVEVATATVRGLVVDPPVIRGQDLFVPSTGERVSSFIVSDVPDQPILTVGPVYPGSGVGAAPVHLSTGPERQVWMASSAVRKLQISGDDLRSNIKPEALGLTSQPLQYVDRKLFHGRRRAYTDAVTFVRMDRDELTSDTQVVLGARLLAWSVRDEQGSSMIVANEAGAVFRTTPALWTKGGLQTTDVERLPLNEELSEPIAATAIDRGQLAVAAGGPEPKLWILNSVGKLDRALTLTAGPKAPLSFLSGRVLVPQQGRLKLASITSGQSPVEDFTLPTEEAPNARWQFVAATSETDVVAALASGEVILVRYQTTPRHFLGQVARISLGAPLHVRGDQADGLVAFADGNARVHLLDAAGLTSRGQRQLPAAVANDVFLAADSLFVETGAGELHCLARDEALTTRWSLPLEGTHLAGRPLASPAGLLLPLQDGRVLVVHPEEGTVVKTIRTGQGLAGGPFLAGTEVLVPTLDGSIVRLNEAL